MSWPSRALPETAPRGRREHPLEALRAFGRIGRLRTFWAHATFGACSLAGFLFFVGSAPYVNKEFDYVLPQYGFMVRHPFLLAFHASTA